MKKSEYEKLSPEEQKHFMECPECGEMFDRRSLDEVVFHQDRKQRPDFQYSKSERVPRLGVSPRGNVLTIRATKATSSFWF
jgi:hypothetical protein